AGKRSYSGIGGFTTLLHGVLSLKGLVVSFVGLVLIAALGFLSVGHLKKEADDIVNDTLPGLSHAGEANLNLAQAFNRTLLLLMTDDVEQRSKLRKEIESASQRTTSHLGEFKSGMLSPTERKLLSDLIKRRTDYLRIRV